MIQGQDAIALAQAIYGVALTKKGLRITVHVNPSAMTATISNRMPAPVPLLTSHGDARTLADTIKSFHQWGQPIFIGAHFSDELFHFWVEQD